MRKRFKYAIMGLALAAFGFAGCDEQDVVAPISPDGYPTATFTTDFTGSEVTEGDTITYTITLDKMLDHDVTFSVDVKDTETLDEDDFEFEEVTIPAYSTEAQISVVFIEDNIPEQNGTINIELGAFELETRYTLNPATVNPELDLTVKNKNDATGLTILFEWEDDHDDWDLVIIDEAVTAEWSGWAGATGNDPEIAIFSNDHPDGVYYAELDPWDVAHSVADFNISVGHPDQTVEFFEFTYDESLVDSYPVGYGFRVLKIVKAGSNYTCTLVN